MDVGRHHVADGFVDQSVPTYDRQSGKAFRNDTHREVPATIGRV